MFAIGLAAALSAALAACDRKPEGTLTVVAIGGEPTMRDPYAGPIAPPDGVLLANVAQGLVRFDAAGTPVSLIGVHFLAQAGSPERRPRREAQAEVIRRAVVREMAAGREVIVAGDFNDYDPAVPDVAGSAAITG